MLEAQNTLVSILNPTVLNWSSCKSMLAMSYMSLVSRSRLGAARSPISLAKPEGSSLAAGCLTGARRRTVSLRP